MGGILYQQQKQQQLRQQNTINNNNDRTHLLNRIQQICQHPQIRHCPTHAKLIYNLNSMLIKVEDMPAIVATLSHKFKEITVEEPLKIFTLCISDNNLGAEGCIILAKAQWSRHIQAINLCRNRIKQGENNIGNRGCKIITQAEWPLLQTLNLNGNKIDDKGCRHLSKGIWPNLKKVDLWKNSMGGHGCKWLTLASWPYLQELNIYRNNIREKGCEQLSKGQWKRVRIDLNYNPLGKGGYRCIAGKGWKVSCFLEFRQKE